VSLRRASRGSAGSGERIPRHDGVHAHALAVELLRSMDGTLDRNEALSLARRAFAEYMIGYYSDVLRDTRPRTQVRFDAFRRHYEAYASRRDYIDIVSSDARTLSVRYRRCPFHELLASRGIDHYTACFCAADIAFTEACLPGVRFERNHEIATDGAPCDHTWRLDSVE